MFIYELKTVKMPEKLSVLENVRISLSFRRDLER